MADTKERMSDGQQNGVPDETLLIAHATAHLVTGESLELLPFTDENDVKSKVSDLMEKWADSGFLLRGQRIYPWHQVRTIEVLSVEQVPQQLARQRLLDWEAANFAHAQQSFWKTKKARDKKGDGQDEGKESGGKKG